MGFCVIGVTLGALAASGHDDLRRHEARPLSLHGVALPVDGDPAPFVRELVDQWLDTEVTIDAGSQLVRARRRELGAHLDLGMLVRQARLARGLGPWPHRVWDAIASGPSTNIAFAPVVRSAELRGYLESLRSRVEVAPRAVGRLDQGRAGVVPALDGSVTSLSNALIHDQVFVQLPLLRVEPPPREIRNGSNLFREVLATYETRYSYANQGHRATNVEIATGLLDGAIIPPEGVLSFNAMVGERSFERGFLPATELDSGGRRVDGIGGGVCQVAATLYAAAFYAAFEVVEHHPHTRNSSYVVPGLDSAVSWPNRDVRVRNPHPFSVRVRASAVQGHLRVALMGARPAPPVDFHTEVLERVPRRTEREVDSNLPLNAVNVIDEGEDGSVLEVTRTIHWADGPIVEQVDLRYPVVSRLLRVGPSQLR